MKFLSKFAAKDIFTAYDYNLNSFTIRVLLFCCHSFLSVARHYNQVIITFLPASLMDLIAEWNRH